jgi:hypothetical protein
MMTDPLIRPTYHDESKTIVCGRFSGLWIHIVNTSHHKSSSGWLNTWEKVTGETPTKCAFVGCNSPAILGAHVRWDGNTSRYASWYIAPSCHDCNSKHGKGSPIKRETKLMKIIEGRVGRPNRILSGRLETDGKTFRQRFWKTRNKQHPPVSKEWPKDWCSCACCIA